MIAPFNLFKTRILIAICCFFQSGKWPNKYIVYLVRVLKCTYHVRYPFLFSVTNLLIMADGHTRLWLFDHGHIDESMSHRMGIEWIVYILEPVNLTYMLLIFGRVGLNRSLLESFPLRPLMSFKATREDCLALDHITFSFKKKLYSYLYNCANWFYL